MYNSKTKLIVDRFGEHLLITKLLGKKYVKLWGKWGLGTKLKTG